MWNTFHCCRCREHSGSFCLQECEKFLSGSFQQTLNRNNLVHTSRGQWAGTVLPASAGIRDHIVWVSLISTPFPVQNADVQIHHLSSFLGQLQPLFALWAVHMQAVVLLLWLRLSCRFALVVEKVLYQSIQPCHGRSPLFSNKFLHFYILCYPLFLLFIPRVSDPAVTPWQIHLLAAWLRWIRSSSKSWLGNSWIRTRLLVRSCSR